jgi:NDP-sugar pyrophosphorylase family protein
MNANDGDRRLREVKVILPVGGLAVRARAVTGDAIPKHLLPFGNGQPILTMVCRELQRLGFRDFVFCVGFLKEQIIRHVTEESWITSEDTHYQFSDLDVLRGPDGAVLGAIRSLGLTGYGMMIPGDIMLPWDGIAEMNLAQLRRGSGITAAVTSFNTNRTADVGKFLAEPDTGRLIRVYGRGEDAPLMPGTVRFSSGGAIAFSVAAYAEVCNAYVRTQVGPVEYIGLRDQVFPWALETRGLDLYVHDLSGEVLDLGTPPNILHVQENWRRYVSDEVARMQ